MPRPEYATPETPSHRRLRVFQVIGQLKRGGREFQMVQLVGGLMARGVEVKVVAFFGGPWLEVLNNELKVSVEIIHPHLIRVPALLRRFRAWQPDVVHTHLGPANLYGRIAGRLARVPAVIAQEGNDGTEKSMVRSTIDRILARWCDRVIINNQRGVDGYARLGVPRQIMRVVPNGMDVEGIASAASPAARELLPFGNDTIVIGTVGRLSAQKNHMLLMETFKKLQGKHPHLRLVIVGDGALRTKLERFAAELDITDKLYMAGQVKDAYRFAAAFDIFVLSSNYEGQSNALIECMMVGTPAVVTNAGGNRELIDHERSGLVVPLKDSDALATAIERMLEDRSQARKWSQVARDYARSQFSIEALTNNVLALYREVLESKGGWSPAWTSLIR